MQKRAILTTIMLLASLALVSGQIAAQDVTSTTVNLTWTAPGDDGDIGTATQYDIRYSLNNISESNWLQATSVANTPAPKAAGNTETFTVTGLDPATTYYFAIRTVDDGNNWSEISNVVSKTTMNEIVAPGDIADLGISLINETTVELTWTAPGDDNYTGTATTYDIRYATTPITPSNWNSATPVASPPTPQAAGSAESFEITGLSSATTYYFAVKTADEADNWSGLSNVVNILTEDLIPPGRILDLSMLPNCGQFEYRPGSGLIIPFESPVARQQAKIV